MKNNYLSVVACLVLLCTALNSAISQNPLQFLDCASDSVSLCVSDEGVSLPANNKVYLGEGHPEATSCSVHLSQKTRVRSFCSGPLQYEVRLYLYDTSAPIILKSVTSVEMDSLSVAELSFDSELSPDSAISQNGIPYTTGCSRYHRIEWIVTDSCGEQVTCDKKVVLYDCFKPLYNISDNYIVYTANAIGNLHMYLEDFEFELIDDCSSDNDYLFSFLPDQHIPDSIFWICDFQNWGVGLLHDIWIADKGVDANCNGFIEWSERRVEKEQIKIVVTDNGNIDCWQSPSLSGVIKTEWDEPIAKAEVTLESEGQIFPTYITVEDGRYEFSNLILPSNFTIHVERNDNHKNGVSTLDLIRILKHLLGKEPFTSPYQYIAADADNSQYVSAIDLVQLRKLILGITTEFPNNQSWRFVPEDYIFSDISDPWPFDEEIEITDFNSNTIQNFIGNKIGDVNNTAIPNVTSIQVRSQDLFTLSSNDQEYKAGQSVEIKFTTKELKRLQGFQFTLSSPDLIFESAASETINISEENYAVFGDKMTFSWFDEDEKTLSDNDVIFTVKARANASGFLSNSLIINSDITEAEMYTTADEIFRPILSIAKPESENMSLFSPQPNPWKENTEIPFYIDQPGNVAFQIFDLNGEIIYSTSAVYGSGYNAINISSSEFEEKGLLIYTIRTADGISSGKMIVLDK